MIPVRKINKLRAAYDFVNAAEMLMYVSTPEEQQKLQACIDDVGRRMVQRFQLEVETCHHTPMWYAGGQCGKCGSID